MCQQPSNPEKLLWDNTDWKPLLGVLVSVRLDALTQCCSQFEQPGWEGSTGIDLDPLPPFPQALVLVIAASITSFGVQVGEIDRKSKPLPLAAVKFGKLLVVTEKVVDVPLSGLLVLDAAEMLMSLLSIIAEGDTLT